MKFFNMSAELFDILCAIVFFLFILPFVLGPIVFAVIKYKSKRSLITAILHYCMQNIILIAFFIGQFILMSYLNNLMQSYFEQHILSFPVRLLSTSITCIIFLFSIIVLMKWIPKPVFIYYICMLIIISIYIAFVLFPYRAYFFT